MWPVLISSTDIAVVPSPLVEKDSFPTEKDALEHSHVHTHSSTFEQWEEAGANRKWLLLRQEWKDQVAAKSTKPRATLRAARCQQLLFSFASLSHPHTANTHNYLWREQSLAFCGRFTTTALMKSQTVKYLPVISPYVPAFNVSLSVKVCFLCVSSVLVDLG